MINHFIRRIIDINQKELDRYHGIVQKINSLEEEYKKLKDSDITKKSLALKDRAQKGEELSKLIPEAYALVRETSYRTLGMRHHDVQLMAAIALFEGKVAEQKTGEGKTLSAVPALYLRALMGKGAHLVTVNDYLARRDAGWNGPIFAMLGLTVGTIIQESKSFIYDPDYIDKSHGDERLAHLRPVERKEAYKADITYGTNNEFGFDYLRDNMVTTLDEMVQRGHYFAIVDEVDSVLIDEARTPLIISAPDTEPTDKYIKFARLVDKLEHETDYNIDEKLKSATLTEHGISKIEKLLGVENLYEHDFDSIHHIENALRARTLYLKDRDYIVKDGQVIIVDEFTGRLMFGRRWSDGLHQSVEAKEGATIQQESKTLATISFQNLFRMYEHLSGMTGTAATEADEFKKIYKLDVVVIPTHRPMARIDEADSIYKSTSAKYTAIVNKVQELYKKGQPILVGTTSIDKNEIVSEYLKRKKIPHNVLNAKNHEREAMIITQAGKPHGVTIATNMAGRGVDIVLGGAPPDRLPGMTTEKYEKTKEFKEWKKSHDEVVSLGGVFVLGTERHESRRIDNQLRGRSGRQGDPGASKFYLSLEDDLMRIFGGAQISSVMDRLKLPEDQPIENKIVSRAIEGAQIKVEGFHFDVRKRLVEYDDVANQQREIIYKLRRRILEAKDLKEEVLEKLYHQIDRLLLISLPEEEKSRIPSKSKKVSATKEDYERVVVGLLDIVPFDDNSYKGLLTELQKVSDTQKIKELLYKIITDVHLQREKQVGETTMRLIEKYAYLNAIDHLWIDHLDHIEDLREGINLRAYGQRDPLVEFKNEAFILFENLMDKVDEELSHRIFRISVSTNLPTEIPLDQAQTNIDKSDQIGLVDPEEKKRNPLKVKKVTNSKKKTLGRNDPCWCGSGKKFKKCHYPQLPA